MNKFSNQSRDEKTTQRTKHAFGGAAGFNPGAYSPASAPKVEPKPAPKPSATNANNSTSFSWIPWSSDYAPGGRVEQMAAAQEKAKADAVAGEQAAHNQKMNNEMMTALLGLGLFGVGAGLTGTKLYNLISGVNPVKNKYKKFGPGPKTLDEEEKVAGDDWIKTITDALSAGLERAKSVIPTSSTFSGPAGLDQNQRAFFVPAALATAGLGLYGGNAIVSALDEKKRKEDIEYELANAKQEYLKALTGKRAAVLDTAFNTYTKSAHQEKAALVNELSWVGDKLLDPLRIVGALPMYSTAVLGTGALAGKMTYDWARERSKDKALERARRSRARIEDTNPLYIDPAQLEAVKALHQKEMEKIRQKEKEQELA